MRDLYTGESALSSAAIEARHISEPFLYLLSAKGENKRCQTCQKMTTQSDIGVSKRFRAR